MKTPLLHTAVCCSLYFAFCTAQQPTYLGYSAEQRNHLDTDNNRLVLSDVDQTSPMSGVVIGFQVYTGNSNLVHLSVWRPAGGIADTYSWVGGVNFVPPTPGYHEIVFTAGEYFIIETDDILGFWYQNSPVPYNPASCVDHATKRFHDTIVGAFDPNVNITMDVENSACREYSYRAVIVDFNHPMFSTAAPTSGYETTESPPRGITIAAGCDVSVILAAGSTHYGLIEEDDVHYLLTATLVSHEGDSYLANCTAVEAEFPMQLDGVHLLVNNTVVSLFGTIDVDQQGMLFTNDTLNTMSDGSGYDYTSSEMYEPLTGFTVQSLQQDVYIIDDQGVPQLELDTADLPFVRQPYCDDVCDVTEALHQALPITVLVETEPDEYYILQAMYLVHENTSYIVNTTISELPLPGELNSTMLSVNGENTFVTGTLSVCSDNETVSLCAGNNDTLAHAHTGGVVTENDTIEAIDGSQLISGAGQTVNTYYISSDRPVPYTSDELLPWEIPASCTPTQPPTYAPPDDDDGFNWLWLLLLLLLIPLIVVIVIVVRVVVAKRQKDKQDEKEHLQNEGSPPLVRGAAGGVMKNSVAPTNTSMI